MNFAILALGIACMGVSIGEGILVGSFMKAAARQPELFNKLRTMIFLGVGFIEGTFFVTFAFTFFVK
ncbi:F0F1 ATP synthase subunit C [Streptococcus sp. DD12]|uniref:F0F1 ATP synthase subunit C n=1 Tax=Streptococcus sp. DD12 TaxID=1777880 RepID=UPI0007993942|nr:F0F1 ATP synthase subunit C [Streptococcus sp. DD12]KXT75773.1 ATP synthase C chain [Streptococcus sp. DD12]